MWTDEQIERVAGAIEDALNLRLSATGKRKVGLAALDAALGDTHVVVPREPTMAMRNAANKATVVNYVHLSHEHIVCCYRAMIAAALTPLREEKTDE
jgi:hypothetical protein